MKDTAVNSARSAALKVVNTLRASGFTAYFAGGCVRDMLMERTPVDYDVATNATPEQISRLFPKTVQVGAAFGVVRVIIRNQQVEVATFRRDFDSKDGRHPVSVEFCDAAEDAKRRDFTINGMFLDPASDRIIDYVKGQEDIEHRLIRAIGDPAKRFQEDYLRMLRAARFASVLNFKIEENTATAIRKLAPMIAKISNERIQQELSRLLTESPRAGDGLALLHNLKLLHVILPEVTALIGQKQPEAFHPEGDVFTHTVNMLNAMEQPSITLAFAVLFHDIGKPPTASNSTGKNGHKRIRFNNHAKVGAEITEKIMRRLRFPNQTIEEVSLCVKNHMRFLDVQHMKQSTLRKMIAAPTFPVELELHRLDCLCSHGNLDNYEYLKRVMKETGTPEKGLPPPWINGRDLLKLGIPKGPEIGKWLQKAYDMQLENRVENRDALLRRIRDSLSHGSTAQVDMES